MSPKRKRCKGCGLYFSEVNKDLFVLHYHILKDGTKVFTYRNLCWQCREKGKLSKSENRKHIRRIKTITPCTDCKKFYPYYVMHFDHLRDKKFDIGSSDKVSFDKLLAEIAKCEVVCANCHAQRTHTRKVGVKIERIRKLLALQARDS